MSIQDLTYKFNYLLPNEALEFPAKINIHFPVRGALYFSSVEINSRISETTKNEISFQPNSFKIPHITLYMGFVNSLRNLNYVLKRTEEFSRQLAPMEIEITKPYVKPPRNNWVFLDVLPAEKIKEIKADLKKKMGRVIIPLSWDVVAEPPHITVGYIKRKQDQVSEMLETLEFDTKSVAEAIEVSFSGSRGSCLGSIRTFELRR